ncbi:MAG: hypothetical protein REI96_11425 [Flavobacterium nitrogenifigens]|uniref:hypothetical protein n=1 Tax=Flavobacterium nitrogenifigens TaxID=1617283 RepID=UPI002809008D|nr:hypothetical protein [Flavobacterium nitrogenifigens]MDQ8013052.1 hypothetical protein [Flavobacterium nitrogenifigens]
MVNSIEKEVQDLTNQLLELVNLYCWNDISNNLMFILSDISEVKGENFFIQRANRNKLNKKKTLKSFNEVLINLKEIYNSIYDINLYVYKVEKHQTIIDIRYFLKTNLDSDFFETISNNPPMLHCKITKPPYLKNETEKFDINWELGGMRYKWNMFYWKTKYKWDKVNLSFTNLK